METKTITAAFEPIQLKNKECLRFVFEGVLTKETAVTITTEWKRWSAQNPQKKYVVIFNAREMNNYDPIARNLFQKTISELKNQIESIWVVTDSKLISAGAAIMSLFISFPIKTVRHEEEIAF